MLQSLSPQAGPQMWSSSPQFADHEEFEYVEVIVPPGPLGILLDGSETLMAKLEGFAPISADETQRGVIELDGRVLPGSILVSVNQYNFLNSHSSFQEISQVLRDTAHTTRTMVFKVPMIHSTNALLGTNSPQEKVLDLDQELEQDQERLRTSSNSSNTVMNQFAARTSSWTRSLSNKFMTSVQAVKARNSFAKSMGSQSESIPGSPKSSMSPTYQAQVSYQSEEVAVSPTIIRVHVPPGPLGLNLNGDLFDVAQVTGFIPLPDGSSGALEMHGGIIPGSTLVEINGESMTTFTLDNIRQRLIELSSEPKTIGFILPPPTTIYTIDESMETYVPKVIRMVEDLSIRRKLELNLIMKHDSRVLKRKDFWCLVDTEWMNRWIEFAARDGPLPGPMTNENLLQDGWKERMENDAIGRPDLPRTNLQVTKDYRGLTPMVFALLEELHGPGEAPVLARYKLDIDSATVPATDFQQILHTYRLKATFLVKELKEMCLVPETQ